MELKATKKCPTYKEGVMFDAPDGIWQHLVAKGYAVNPNIEGVETAKEVEEIPEAPKKSPKKGKK